MNEVFRTFGGRLRELLEERSVSVEELAKATKIRSVILDAIFRGRREDLPDDVFVIGFLRAILSYLGSAPDPWIEEFRALSRPEDEGDAEAGAKSLNPVPEISSKSHLLLWLFLVALIVACSGLYLFRFSLPELKERLFPPGEGKPAAVKPESRKPEKKEPPAENRIGESGVRPPAAQQGLEIIVRSRCWIELTGEDDRKLMRREAAAGEDLHFPGRSFTISLGDSSALDIFFDGNPVEFERAGGKVIKGMMIGGGQK